MINFIPKNNYKICDNYAIIYLDRKNKSSLETFVDIEDLERILSFPYKWHSAFYEDNKSYYAVSSYYLEIFDGKPKYKNYRLNRFVMNCPHNFQVDHENHDTLDNRRKNLRIVLDIQNYKNKKTKNKNNKSGIRNMCWINGWLRLQLQINGENYKFPEKFDENHLEEAREFANAMRLKYYGEYSGNE
jgi:hypothetical protein